MQITDGFSEKSLAIEVACKYGIPEAVTDQAREFYMTLSQKMQSLQTNNEIKESTNVNGFTQFLQKQDGSVLDTSDYHTKEPIDILDSQAELIINQMQQVIGHSNLTRLEQLEQVVGIVNKLQELVESKKVNLDKAFSVASESSDRESIVQHDRIEPEAVDVTNKEKTTGVVNFKFTLEMVKAELQHVAMNILGLSHVPLLELKRNQVAPPSLAGKTCVYLMVLEESGECYCGETDRLNDRVESHKRGRTHIRGRIFATLCYAWKFHHGLWFFTFSIIRVSEFL